MLELSIYLFQHPVIAGRPSSTVGFRQGAHPTVAQAGRYRIQLRIPETGLFAGEALDLEFRVTDPSQVDPVEGGPKGIGGIKATAVVTMPSMSGMPEARPKIHREGVPGDYGLELFFPHGGEYRIALRLELPDGELVSTQFLVPVKDEKPNRKSRPPYALKVIDWPADATAGQPVNLRMRVIDSKTNRTQRDFDVAHEKKFHLLLASKDLNWFAHEHPEMGADGVWSLPVRFPAGGEYIVYGDVAPSGQGSRIVSTRIRLSGTKPNWNQKITLTKQGKDQSMRAELSSLGPISVGSMATLQVKLVDIKSAKPVSDTEKWLGAAGHMMIFLQDGNTVVHSHPAEDEESEALVRRGVVRFSARFPKAGIYKVYAQFSRGGRIHTIPFGIKVSEVN